MNFDIAYHIFLPALQKIAALTHSYGWAIVLLTIAFRLLVSPLVAQTTISMRRMSKLQPQMKILQQRYKDNPEQLQKKLMEFYSKNKINPVGGCLPTLVQLPLLFAFYATFNGPPFTDRILDVKVNVVAPENSQSVSRAEVSSANSIFLGDKYYQTPRSGGLKSIHGGYISDEGVAAKLVVYPGNSTVVTGTDISFGIRAIEGKIAPDFSPQWQLMLPANHEIKEAQSPVAVGEKTANVTPQPQSSLDAVSKKSTASAVSGSAAQPYIDTTGHAFFPTVGEYHVQAIIPGIAKNERFAFISGLGKVATGVSLLKPANFDIVFLILLFGGSMFLSQKLTVPAPKPKEGEELDEQQMIQQQTMKTMPLVTTGMFFFFPIPAGVYLYLVVSNIIQTIQTWFIARMPEPDFGDTGENTVVEGGSSGGGLVGESAQAGGKRNDAGINPQSNVKGEKNGDKRSQSNGNKTVTAGKSDKKKSRRKKK